MNGVLARIGWGQLVLLILALAAVLAVLADLGGAFWMVWLVLAGASCLTVKWRRCRLVRGVN